MSGPILRSILLFLLLEIACEQTFPAAVAGSVLTGNPRQDTPGTLTISVQPADQTDCKGNKVTYSVVAKGGSILHYLWKRKRPTDAAFASFGAADSTKLAVYNIGTGTEAPDGTLYQVTVADQSGTVTSRQALLTVNQITGIAPVGIATFTVNEGENLSLTVLTSGNSPSSFQWIKKFGSNDWRDLTDNTTISGSRSAQLNFTKIALLDSGVYKVRVTFPTMNGDQCTETSSLTRTIHVKPIPDVTPPLFVNLNDTAETCCPEGLEQAEWNELLADILPERTKYYRLHKFSPQFDLSTSHFFDNVTPPADLILHWGIFRADAPFDAVTDRAGNVLSDTKGQISLHPEDIDLESYQSGSRNYLLIFWLEDRAGNLTPDVLRHRITLTIPLRPGIASQF